ncbi:MAG: ThiF family adenylyltransferase [Candidatus Omnitrophica bacterium]|nr:ThiF family adenylyltransferase [Candidatus Omnitrophota bacterium]
MKMTLQDFDYNVAFDRNRGWLTAEDQAKLRKSCVAIPGLGGAGGYLAEVLVRLGVAKFKIGDPDTFEPTNFNRQIGAAMQTLGQSKTEVIQRKILSINPEAQIEVFPEGLTPENSDAFLNGSNLAIDGIDFFALDAKAFLFQRCRAKKIPVITSCPLGFGASLIVFSPTGMDYRTYFDFRDDMKEEEKRLALAFGLSPAPFALKYMDRDALNLGKGRAGSVCPGLMLVGALAATEAVKILTGKGKVHYCPFVYQIDLFTQKVRRKYYARGMGSPWMRAKRWIVSQLVNRKKS